jgi:hypothetical protein
MPSKHDARATKRNPNQQKDFVKKRNKVGKKKLPARSATRAIARTRVIALPPQTLRTERAAVATHRNVSMSELLVQCAHFSPKVRRDALAGVRELLLAASAAATASASLHAVLDRTLTMVADDVVEVRRALSQTLDALWRAVDARQLAPFASLVVAHFCAALTHMSERVRVESLALVDRFVAIHARAVAAPIHWIPLLQCFDHDGGLLKLAVTGRSSVRIAIRDAVLSSLSRLLTVALEHHIGAANASTVTNADTAPIAAVRAVDAAVDAGAGVTSVAALSNSPAALDAFLMQFAERAVPTLLQCWLECAPSEPRPAAAELAHMRAVLDTLLTLLEAIGQRTGARLSRAQIAAEWRRRFLRSTEQYVFVHFPMLAPETNDGNGVDNVDEPRLAINVAVARLMATYLPMSISERAPDWLAGKLLPFVESALRSRLASRRWTTLAPLLDIVEQLLEEHTDVAARRSLFAAFAYLFSALPPSARDAKGACVAILRRMIERTPTDAEADDLALIVGCVNALPRMLWQLRAEDAAGSLACLDALLSFVRRHPTQAAALGAIESGLVPFFFTHRRDTGAPLFGPFVALDEALQRRALDVARYVLEATQGAALVRAIAACFVSSTKPPVLPGVGATLYALETVGGVLPLELHINFAMTLLLETRNDSADVRWSRREAVANHIVVSLRGVAGGASALDALLEPLLADWLASEHVADNEAALLVIVRCRRLSARLAPHYARAVVRNALWRPTAGVAPWSWLLTAHEPLLLECIDLVVTQTEPSSLDAVKTLSDLALRWKLAHSHAPLPTAQSNSMRRFASVASEHFAESGARLMQLASE